MPQVRLGPLIMSQILYHCAPQILSIVKPVLNGHSKTDKIKLLMTNGSLMKVESIAECNTFDLH